MYTIDIPFSEDTTIKEIRWFIDGLDIWITDMEFSPLLEETIVTFRGFKEDLIKLIEKSTENDGLAFFNEHSIIDE